MISYDGLERALEAKGLKRSDLTAQLGISSRTVARIAKGEKLSTRTLQKIGDFLECPPDDLWREISPNPVLQVLREEKAAGISGGLYHELQVRMTYNSNRIEGSRLTDTCLDGQDTFARLLNAFDITEQRIITHMSGIS
mgnify:CR=1 FL=1